MARTRLPLGSAPALLLCAACGADPAPGGGADAGADAARGKPVVLTTFYPTTYLAERLAGERAEVRLPLPADADPIFWKPSADAIAAYQAADLIVVNGAELEKWVGQVSLPAARVVDTAAGFRAQWVRYEEQVTHSHGPEGEHAHEGVDGHTWMDPVLAILQARAIADALIRLDPGDAVAIETVEANFAALEAELQELHLGFEALGPVPAGESLYASHPAYNYLKARYGWRVVNLDLDPEEMPSAEALAALRERLQATPGRFLLWEGEPTAEIAAAMAELGLTSVLVSPCEGAPATGEPDFLETMRANLERLRPAFAAGD